MTEKFSTRINDTIKMYPVKSFALSILIAFAGACLLALGQA